MSGDWSHLWSDYPLEEWRVERYMAAVEAMEEKLRAKVIAKNDATTAYLDRLRAKRDGSRGVTPERPDDDVNGAVQPEASEPE
ncbi:hypothetical protein [Streptomyces hokutonensis]|uniref:hypothetical protein n=1 Tax=Streptomyces hokutonensis TaxID=1306990 RepID=UPI0037F46B99